MENNPLRAAHKCEVHVASLGPEIYARVWMEQMMKACEVSLQLYSMLMLPFRWGGGGVGGVGWEEEGGGGVGLYPMRLL